MRLKVTGPWPKLNEAIIFAMDHGFAVIPTETVYQLVDGWDASEIDEFENTGNVDEDAATIRRLVLAHTSEQRDELYRAHAENRLLRDYIEAHHGISVLDQIDQQITKLMLDNEAVKIT